MKLLLLNVNLAQTCFMVSAFQGRAPRVASAPLESTAGLFQPLEAGHSSKKSLFVAEPTNLWCDALGRAVAPLNPFPVHTQPGCKLFSLMLVRRSLGKTPCHLPAGCQGWCGVLTHALSWQRGSPLQFSPHPGREKGVCAAKQPFPLPSSGSPLCIPVQLCTPLPASQGWGALPGSGSLHSGHSRAEVWCGLSQQSPQTHHQCTRVALASRPLITHFWLSGQSPNPDCSSSSRLPAPQGGWGTPFPACSPGWLGHPPACPHPRVAGAPPFPPAPQGGWDTPFPACTPG